MIALLLALLAGLDVDLAVRAGRVHLSDRVLENGVVLVREGKVVGIGEDLAMPSGAEVIDVPAGVVTPGFVLLHSRLGVEAGPITGDGDPGTIRRADEWVRWTAADLEAAISLGWTTAEILPPARRGGSLGETVVVTLHPGRSLEEARLPARSGFVLEVDASVTTPEAWLQFAAVLDDILQRARHASGQADRGELNRLPERTLRLVTATDWQRWQLRDLFRERGIPVTSAVSSSRVVETPAEESSSRRVGETLIRIFSSTQVLLGSRDDVSTALLTGWCAEGPGLRDPRIELLRLRGEDGQIPLDRLTWRAADLLGLDAGRIELGAPADLVVYDGPLGGAGTRVLFTIVSGDIVYRAAERAKSLR